MANYDTVLFDLYGTLAYSNNYVDELTLFLRQNTNSMVNYNSAKEICLTNDISGYLLVAEIVDSSFEELYNLNIRINNEVEDVNLYPETLQVLNHLKSKGYKLGLVSNLATPYKSPFFNHGLDNYFDESVFSCDVGLKKPDKRIYDLAMEKLGSLPENSIMIGDGYKSDYEGAKEAGLNAFYLDRTNSSQDSINSLKDIIRVLK